MPETAMPEQRTVTADVQDVRTEGRTLHGFAALYGVESRDLGGYTERIAPGAFADALAGDPDVLLTVNHSPDRVLARTASGTLRLRDEARGLAFEADLGDGPTAQDVRDMVRRGDVSGASFRFVLADGGDSWDGERRTLTRVGELLDVSLATVPAYDGPRVELRTFTPTPQEDPAMPENTAPAAEADPRPPEGDDLPPAARGTLRVEDRAASDEGLLDRRVETALRSISPGEARSLTTANADPVAPEEQGTFLWDALRPSSVMLASGLRVIPTTRESIAWPRLTADVDPTWVAETVQIPEGDPAFAALQARPRKLAHRVELSNEIIDDSNPAIVSVLNGHLATMLALKLDKSILEGNPAANAESIRGLKYTPGIQSIDLGANGGPLTFDVLLEAVGLLRAANVPGPYRAVMAVRSQTALTLLHDADGNYMQAPADVPPISATAQLSTTETKGTSSNASSVYVFAPPQLVLVRRADATIELDRSRLFDRDMSEMRAKLRADFIVPDPAAVVRVEGVTPAS